MAGALRDLRRTRQSRRLGDAEWFDVAYRVYLFALVGLTGVVLASDAIDGVVGDGIKTSDLLARGPSVATSFSHRSTDDAHYCARSASESDPSRSPLQWRPPCSDSSLPERSKDREQHGLLLAHSSVP